MSLKYVEQMGENELTRIAVTANVSSASAVKCGHFVVATYTAIRTKYSFICLTGLVVSRFNVTLMSTEVSPSVLINEESLVLLLRLF